MIKRIKAFFKDFFTPAELTVPEEFYTVEDPVPEKTIDEIRPAKPQRKTVLISAGHSDSDPGATGTWEGAPITEAAIVLEFRNKVAGIIKHRGYSVITDGVGERNLPLMDAINLAKGVDVAVEFHCNAFHMPTATGVEVLTGGNHQGLSDRLTRVISSVLNIPNRGVKPENSGQHSRLGFISKGDGIIVELMFITNQRDLTAYFSNIDLLASKTAEVLIDYIT